jgi:hypothetical protein
MFNLFEIAKKNYSTFYDFDSGRRHRLGVQFAIVIGTSIVLSSLNITAFSDFLNSVLAVEAILVGFSFSVMFFLLSESGASRIEPESLEDEVSARKLATLQKEIFYNVSYFNVTAVAVVLCSLFLLFPSFNFVPWHAALELLSSALALDLMGMERLVDRLQRGFHWLLWFLFYLFLLESMLTFIRTVGRVSYYFTSKISRLSKQ